MRKAVEHNQRQGRAHFRQLTISNIWPYLALFLMFPVPVHADLGHYAREWSVPQQPIAVREGPDGSIWVTCFDNVVRKYTPAGGLLLQIGSSGSGPGQFNEPFDIVFASTGDFFVADYVNHRIQKFTSTGIFMTSWTVPAIRAVHLAVDNTDHLYVTDFSAGFAGQPLGRVWKYDDAGTLLASWVVGSGAAPTGIVFFNNSLYVTTWFDGKIWQYDLSGILLSQFAPAFGVQSEQMAVDQCGRLYLAAYPNDLVSSFTTDGTPLGTTGTHGSEPAQFVNPQGVAVASSGEIFVADRGNNRIQVFSGPPESVAGLIHANCPSPNTPLLGVRVDAYELGSGDLVGTGISDASGSYLIQSLSAGTYTLTVVAPLGYSATAPEVQVTICGGNAAIVDFSLDCVPANANPRGIGFWKHQVGVATGGRGTAQVDPETLCSWLDLIEAHFNSNLLNHVIVYQPPSSETCIEKLEVARTLLNLAGKAAMIDRSKQNLMALLLNVAAGYLPQNRVISADGATISQAITYCDNLIDNPTGDYQRAKDIAETINDGRIVGTGVIPVSTPHISYAHETPYDRLGPSKFAVNPNPSAGKRSFGFELERSSSVDLTIFDITGRRVAEVYHGVLGKGFHTLSWDGQPGGGAVLRQGIYFAKLSTSGQTRVAKLIQVDQ